MSIIEPVVQRFEKFRFGNEEPDDPAGRLKLNSVRDPDGVVLHRFHKMLVQPMPQRAFDLPLCEAAGFLDMGHLLQNFLHLTVDLDFARERAARGGILRGVGENEAHLRRTDPPDVLWLDQEFKRSLLRALDFDTDFENRHTTPALPTDDLMGKPSRHAVRKPPNACRLPFRVGFRQDNCPDNINKPS